MSVRKFIVAVLGAAVIAVAASLTDDRISTAEWVQLVVAVATAAQVWLTANTPELTWAKTLTAVLLGVANVAVGLIVDGLSASDIAVMIVAAFTAAGVYQVRNAPTSPAALSS